MAESTLPSRASALASTSEAKPAVLRVKATTHASYSKQATTSELATSEAETSAPTEVVAPGSAGGASQPQLPPAVPADVAPRLVLPPPIPVPPSANLPPPPGGSTRIQLEPERKPQTAPRAASPKPPEKQVFMSRKEIEQRRSRCDISREGPDAVSVPAAGGDVRVRYKLSDATACLTGAGSDTNWADVLRAQGDEAVIRVEANTTGSRREATVTVVSRSGKSVSYFFTQQPSSK